MGLLFVHHSAAAMPGNHQPKADEREEMREIQNYHMHTKGWSDIAYSFLIFDSGRIYEGRGWGRAGGHTLGFNTTSYGICFAGNYENEEPTDEAVDAFRWLVAEGKKRGHVKVGAFIKGHRDVSPTACPGGNLYRELPKLRMPWRPYVVRYQVRYPLDGGWVTTKPRRMWKALRIVQRRVKDVAFGESVEIQKVKRRG